MKKHCYRRYLYSVNLIFSVYKTIVIDIKKLTIVLARLKYELFDTSNDVFSLKPFQSLKKK